MFAPFRSSFTTDRAPPSAEIACRFGPGWVFECKAGLQKTTWNHAPALENQLCLGAKKKRADLQHPARRRQSEADAPRLTKSSHEVLIREWMRGGDIDVAGEIFVIDDPANRRREVA